MRDSARIEEHNHLFVRPEHRIIRRMHAHAINTAASDPERHYLPWRTG